MIESNSDNDSDGVNNSLDIDADNDGILDEIEVGDDPTQPRDTDSDGVPDYLDLDSDNDGLTDTLEAGGLDDNGDGVIDNFLDSNADGLDDGVGIAPLPLDDFDTDGIVDDLDLDLDLDSDNDGLSDLLETSGAAVDNEGDGKIDDFSDENGDGLDDSVALAPTLISDIDSDGQSNNLDLDSDGDGFANFLQFDGSEPILGAALPDIDGNGVPDVHETNSFGEWRTGISGSGCSISAVGNQSRILDPMMPLLAIVAVGWLWLRRDGSKKRLIALTIASVFTTGCTSLSQHSSPESAQVQTEPTDDNSSSDNYEDNVRRHVYGGIGLGVSRLEPESRDMVDARVDDSSDTTTQITLCLDINKWLAAELHSADLGTAGLSSGG